MLGINLRNKLINKVDKRLDKIIEWMMGKFDSSKLDFASVKNANLSLGARIGTAYQKLWADDLNLPLSHGLSIILTQKCNLKCDYCLRNANSQDSENPEIPFETLQQIILAAHRIGRRGAGLTGGDFFLYSKWQELIELLGLLGWGCLVETNGILLNRNPEYLDYLIKHIGSRLTVAISLDNYKEEKHDLHRGKGSFRRALEAIKLVKFRIPEAELRISAILTPKNLMTEKEVSNYIDFAKNLGVNRIIFGRVLPVGRGDDCSLLLSSHQISELSKIFEKIRSSEKQKHLNNIIIRWGFLRDMDEVEGCDRLGGRDICVSPYGIHPCIFHQRIKIGELEDFEKIVWSDFFQSFDMLRRAARVGFPHSCFNCGACMHCLPEYLKQLEKIKTINI